MNNIKTLQKQYQDKLAHDSVGSWISFIFFLIAFFTFFFLKNSILFLSICSLGIPATVYVANWKEKQDNVYDKKDRNWTILGGVRTFLIIFFTYLITSTLTSGYF